MRHFEVESERCQLLQPELAVARTNLLDYFRETSAAAGEGWTWREAAREAGRASEGAARERRPSPPR